MAPALLEALPERVLAVYAHPDDAEVSCGGTLARWSAGGAEVHVVVCTKGEKGSSSPEVRPRDLARRRKAEMQRAAAVLGLAGHEQLGYDDGELENDHQLRARIVGVVRRVRPDVVLCPDPTAVFFGDSYFNHRDHRTVGWATLDAVAPAAGNPHYFPEAGAAHEVALVLLSASLEPEIWVDISHSLDSKIDALACHESQLAAPGEPFRDFVRDRAEDAGRVAGVRYAEGFRRLALML